MDHRTERQRRRGASVTEQGMNRKDIRGMEQRSIRGNKRGRRRQGSKEARKQERRKLQRAVVVVDRARKTRTTRRGPEQLVARSQMVIGESTERQRDRGQREHF
jgi:hypothetical protein